MSNALFRARRVLWMPLDLAWGPASGRHCCAEMADSLEMHCDLHADPFECPDVSLVFHEIFGEYGIPIRDGGAGYLIISHCPWCGTQLPESGRDLWFDAVAAAGLADAPTAELPQRFRSSAWRDTSQF